MSDKTIRFTLRLSPHLQVSLRRRASELGRSQADLARQILETAMFGDSKRGAVKQGLANLIWLREYLSATSTWEAEKITRLWEIAEQHAEQILAEPACE